MGRGRLRVYLGAAPGVGKTFAMLGRGSPPRRARHRRGRRLRRDARTTAHRRPARTGSRSCPVASSTYRGATFTEMDVDAVLRRQPAGRAGRRARAHQCPGLAQREALAGRRGAARRRHRRHLDRQHPAPRVAQRRRREDHRGAAAGDGCRTRWSARPTRSSWSTWPPRRCDGGWRTATSTPPRRSMPPSGNYFRVGNLTALRELALLWTADKVDEAMQGYRAAHGIDGHLGDPRTRRRRPHRRARRGDPDPPGGAHRRPLGRRRPARRARRPLRRAHRRQPGRPGDPTAAGREPGRHLPPGHRRRRGRRRCWSSPAPRTPPSSCSAAAGGPGSAR